MTVSIMSLIETQASCVPAIFAGYAISSAAACRIICLLTTAATTLSYDICDVVVIIIAEIELLVI